MSATNPRLRAVTESEIVNQVAFLRGLRRADFPVSADAVRAELARLAEAALAAHEAAKLAAREHAAVVSRQANAGIHNGAPRAAARADKADRAATAAVREYRETLIFYVAVERKNWLPRGTVTLAA